MFESVLLFKCAEYLSTSDNQFGFKSSHSTDLCIYNLKEFIDYYISRGITVYVTFLDTSKAFDQIDHWLLFDKMIKKGVHSFIIKLRVFYTHIRKCLYAGVIHVPPVFVLQTVLNRAVLFCRCILIYT